jgi:MFS family permease
MKATNSSLGTTVAIYEVGCTFGAFACYAIGDRLGRRRTIFGAGIVTLLGVAIQSSSFGLAQFIVARIIIGEMYLP